ncbi:MAG TPA: tetratricopeptide repeat protein [Gemmatales bacterium]|nr:tetratricopeptide repeat protein [Gemmatales bacterium]HMP61229.1 tetratricopeptide repeat protein [Gemmatales bacterium]
MGLPLLVQYCESLASRKRVTSRSIARFVEKVKAKYTEGTLARLLEYEEPRISQAALLALRFVGTMASTPMLAQFLAHDDPEVRGLAEAALWSIWFRADSEESAAELQRLTELIERKEHARAMAGLNRLIGQKPKFAEAYNQRAILFWRQHDFESSIADCQRVLKLNPFHFGAQAGLAQCLLSLDRPAEALTAFRKALAMNPHLDGVERSIYRLERLLGQMD